LKQSAASIETIVGGIDKTVNGLLSTWDGPDAQRFVQQTWPTFRKSFAAAQTSVDGLGQSALNNAAEQRQASSANGSGSHSGTSLGGGANATQPAPTPGHSTTDGVGSTGVGGLPGGDVKAYRQYEEATKKYWYTDKTTGEVVYTDGHNEGKDNCTAWVDWRREQLHLPIATGTGKTIAGLLGGTTTTPPSLGAAVSYTPPDSPDNGHVMVVEQIMSTDPPSFRVSEDNYSNAYNDTRVWTQLSNGNWSTDGGRTQYPLTISPPA
jgi:surface antigen